MLGNVVKHSEFGTPENSAIQKLAIIINIILWFTIHTDINTKAHWQNNNNNQKIAIKALFYPPAPLPEKNNKFKLQVLNTNRWF